MKDSLTWLRSGLTRATRFSHSWNSRRKAASLRWVNGSGSTGSQPSVIWWTLETDGSWSRSSGNLTMPRPWRGSSGSETYPNGTARTEPGRTWSTRWLCLAFFMGLALAAFFCPVAHAEAPDTLTVRLTYYTLRGTMASGGTTGDGAAACSQWIPFGTRLMFEDGFEVVCMDRGHGDWYWNEKTGWEAWIDVWVPNHAAGLAIERQYGIRTTLTVQCWGPCDLSTESGKLLNGAPDA